MAITENASGSRAEDCGCRTRGKPITCWQNEVFILRGAMNKTLFSVLFLGAFAACAADIQAVLAADPAIGAYEIFGLRDGITSGSWHSRFGIVRDDYSRKPAFETVRRLVGG